MTKYICNRICTLYLSEVCTVIISYNERFLSKLILLDLGFIETKKLLHCIKAKKKNSPMTFSAKPLKPKIRWNLSSSSKNEIWGMTD
jgi:hypothetical protein